MKDRGHKHYVYALPCFIKHGGVEMKENETTYEINGVTYLVSTHFSEGDESVLDKIGRLIQEEVENTDSSTI